MKGLLKLLAHLLTTLAKLLDHPLFWNAVDLEKELADFMLYFNQHRVHSRLGGRAPADIVRETHPSQAELRNYRWKTHCRGLYQLPMAA